jgi:hypothetical protein
VSKLGCLGLTVLNELAGTVQVFNPSTVFGLTTDRLHHTGKSTTSFRSAWAKMHTSEVVGVPRFCIPFAIYKELYSSRYSVG